MRLAKVLGGVGRTCITVGALLLLFVAYQLWGTGIREAQAQDQLDKDFGALVDETPPTTTPDPAFPTTVDTIAPAAEGEPTAHIVIPKIGVDKIVVEGVSVPDLKKGPGHYPESPLPGQKGNAAIAGHRTTYGAPFNRIDELEPGDEIMITTVQGTFRYLMTEQLIVSPTAVEVLQDKGDNRLTLTACHPKYSARQRIVVVAELAAGQVALPASATGTPKAIDDIDGEQQSILPVVLLALICALIWLFAWLVGMRWRKWPSYAIGLPFFLVALFFFFEDFSRLLPSNF
jgi:sortase A